LKFCVNYNFGLNSLRRRKELKTIEEKPTEIKTNFFLLSLRSFFAINIRSSFSKSCDGVEKEVKRLKSKRGLWCI
jgi:hypothetical protein